MKNQITKIATVVTLAAMAMSTCVGCGNNAKVDEAETANVEEVEASSEESVETEAEEVVSEENADAEAGESELVTYEFETFDNVKVVLDESNITAQEPSEDPENSELISEDAANNIIAPGRDFLYLEDDNNYYVADFSRGLVTVADKSK